MAMPPPSPLVAILSLFLTAMADPLPAQTPNAPPWSASEEAVRAASDERPGFLFQERGVPDYSLPPLFTEPADRERWKTRRRGELLDLFTRHVYGSSPAPPPPGKVKFRTAHTDPEAMGGAATLKQIDIIIDSRQDATGNEADSVTIHLTLFVPNDTTKPAPAFLLIANRGPENYDPTRRQRMGYFPAEEIIARGYAAAVFHNEDAAPDRRDGHAAGLHALYQGATDAAGETYTWGTLAAWAWGASRCLDAIGAEEGIDATRVAVVGHSRGGKAALWAAATDPRFAMAISNASGCGGAALSRRRYGETISRINRVFPHWFCDTFKEYNDREEELPIDQHMLLALIAPRPLYVASADEDLWADPRGEYLSLHHAGAAFALYGYEPLPEAMPPLDAPVMSGPMGYHIRTGGHDLTEVDWEWFLDFADQTMTVEAD